MNRGHWEVEEQDALIESARERLDALRERSAERRFERFLEERNLEMVAVRNLPDVDLSPAQYEKVSYEQMRASLTLWAEVIAPVVERGEGLDVEYWQQLDDEQGRAPTDGLAHLFNVMYEKVGNPVFARRVGSDWVVDGGRHRIHVAAELGIEFLPVRVR